MPWVLVLRDQPIQKHTTEKSDPHQNFCIEHNKDLQQRRHVSEDVITKPADEGDLQHAAPGVHNRQ